MKIPIKSKPKPTKSSNLGVIIIFIIITILFIISFARSDFRDDLFNSKVLVKPEDTNTISR